MTEKELERIKFIANKFLEMADSLEDKNYDLSKIEFDDKVMKYILGDSWTLEERKIKIEKSRQENIIIDCKRHLMEQYTDYYFIEYMCKVRNYKNYYLVNIFGAPFIRTDFIYDKMGNQIINVTYAEGSIDCIDEDNFFFVKKDKNEMKDSAIHFQFKENKFMLIQVLSDVHTNILPVFGINADVEFGNLVSWNGNVNHFGEKEKSVLYNYKGSEIVVPEFTDAKYEYGDFGRILRDNLIRIINRIEVEDQVTNLEFLIDEDGRLVTDVFDFQKNISYSRENRGVDQVEILNSIYEEVKNNMMGELKGRKVLQRTSNT